MEQIIRVWAIATARELTLADPWSDAIGMGLVAPDTGLAEDANTSFSPVEKAELRQKLDRLMGEIVTVAKLPAEQRRLLAEFVGQQNAAADRLGRIDWKNQFVACALSLALALALSEEARRTMVTAMNGIVGWINGGVRLIEGF